MAHTKGIDVNIANDVINIFCPTWDETSSFGRIARELMSRWQKKGVHVNPFGNGAPEQVIKPCFGGLFLGYPTLYPKYGVLSKNGPRVALAMFESSKLPPGWVEELNACDAVIVPSAFAEQVFVNAGVIRQIHVVPLGISDAYQVNERSEQRPLTFLAFLGEGPRKGYQTAINAFLRAFGDDTRYQLVLKGHPGTLPFSRFSNPNITLVQEDMDDSQLAALYQSCDVLLAPSSGEGFGFLPREFAATGGIAIATNWSGLADEIGRWGWPLRYTLGKAWGDYPQFSSMDVGEWAIPDEDDLVTQMRHIAGLFWKTRRDVGMVAAINARQLYDWNECAERVWAIWQDVLRMNYGVKEPIHHAYV